MKIFSITGWSGSGKTTLITRLIKHFKLKNKKVIVVKGAPHKYYVEPESTDTFKFLEAGADEVCLAAAKEMLTMRSITSKQEVFGILETRYADCDILLIEGLRRDDIPLIEVFDSTQNKTLKFPIEALIAVVSDKPVTNTIPNFNRNDIAEITHFMEDYNG
ncbi:MAG: molybdopterin-guanine dinucleotide biosynthesis protein B [Candidatus Aminicenantes bacterium]|nr:molybdopterin-guanine dinucleotide biosynthesis protein B [Candidatus Aminicenantes bacterium]NIM80380.1 molybdopterin-guanine dinucleotide biosynthesis protein B [Candidatus Aminicenantes bacterium]NIN19767.1 molybdopterin-guanine dinucleotide biosynthesis protein B [Candidatus Aminicenantes bacterium]NIN43649.1 molybdopterin-guanine dinucleotide biosynthesis protein B [Candidatus Aminicenantes bacterium]NIN86394.1 molybdopterin-guanine dinucleotide biosynthesis protein B [Candidatus Aminic